MIFKVSSGPFFPCFPFLLDSIFHFKLLQKSSIAKSEGRESGKNKLLEHGGHGTYIRCLLRNRCAREEQSLLFDLSKAFHWINSSPKFDIFILKRLIFFLTCATYSELPSNQSTMMGASRGIFGKL